MIVPVVFLKNAASEVPVSAHKHVYSQTHLYELRMFSSMVVFLPHCCYLRFYLTVYLKVTLVFKNFMLKSPFTTPSSFIIHIFKNLVEAEETKKLRMKSAVLTSQSRKVSIKSVTSSSSLSFSIMQPVKDVSSIGSMDYTYMSNLRKRFNVALPDSALSLAFKI